MNLKSFLLIGLLTDFRGYLASGLRPICAAIVFCPTDFTDFLWNLWRIALSNPRGICIDRTGRLCVNL